MDTTDDRSTTPQQPLHSTVDSPSIGILAAPASVSSVEPLLDRSSSELLNNNSTATNNSSSALFSTPKVNLVADEEDGEEALEPADEQQDQQAATVEGTQANTVITSNNNNNDNNIPNPSTAISIEQQEQQADKYEDYIEQLPRPFYAEALRYLQQQVMHSKTDLRVRVFFYKCILNVFHTFFCNRRKLVGTLPQ